MNQDEAGTSSDVVDRLLRERPTFHQTRDGSLARWDALPGTLRLIERVTQPGMRTVETGSGASTVVFAAAGCAHTAISPHGGEHDRIREYCAGAGISTEAVEFIVGYSDEVLPRLDGTVDAAFVDGAHRFPAPVVDWHYLARRIPVGGVVILDDVPIPSVRLAHDYMSTAPAWRLETIADRRAAAWRRIERDRQGDPWAEEDFNASYPDLSFLPPAERLSAGASAITRRMRRRLRGLARRA